MSTIPTSVAFDPSSISLSTISLPSSGILYPIANFVTYSRLFDAHVYFLASIIIGSEPTHFSEVARIPFWRQIMCKEIATLKQTGT